MRCSALAEQLDEPMIGTVDQRARWLLVEDRSAWGSDAVADVLGAPLAAALKERGIRALLVRHREGDPAADALRRAILVDTVTREMAVRTIASVEELDVSALGSGFVATSARPWTGRSSWCAATASATPAAPCAAAPC